MQKKKTVGLPDPDPEQQKALATLYELYFGQMYQKAYGILRNRQDAEDAVQEAFYRVCLNAEVFLQPHSETAAALIHTYTRNVAINHYHRKKRHRALLSDEPGTEELQSLPENDIAVLIEREETAAELRKAVDALEPHYREVIMLKYYEHKKNTEIAAQLGLAQNVVNGRIWRAKRALRRMLEQEY